MSRIRSKKDPNRKGAFIKPEPVKQEPEEDIKQITIPESLTIRESRLTKQKKLLFLSILLRNWKKK